MALPKKRYLGDPGVLKENMEILRGRKKKKKGNWEIIAGTEDISTGTSQEEKKNIHQTGQVIFKNEVQKKKRKVKRD